MTTGQLIKNARKRANLTQKELGERAGIAEPTIRKYESDRLNPKPATLKKIADAIGDGVKWYELYSDDPNEQGNIIKGNMKDRISKMGPLEKVSNPEKIGFIQFKSPDDEIAYFYSLLNDAGKFEAARCFSRHLDPQTIPEVIQYLQRLSETDQYKKTPPGDGGEGEG